MSVHEAVLSLGSNISPRLQYLKKAFLKITGIGKILDFSSVYETKPWGISVPQNNYLNMVVKIETFLFPFELLKELQKIEVELGRKEKGNYAPRTIDIDIIFYGNEEIKTPELTIPHPLWQKRDFVIVPLLEIGIIEKKFLKTDSFILRKVMSREEVSKWK